MAVGTVDAMNGDDRTNLCVGDFSDINHAHIHGNNAYDGSDLSANEHAASTTERAVNSVAIAGGENRDSRGALGHEFSAVTDRATRRNISDGDNPGAQAHDRLQRQAALGFGALLWRIVAGVIAVEDDARPDHIGPGFRTRGDGGAVRKVHDAGVDA